MKFLFISICLLLNTVPCETGALQQQLKKWCQQGITGFCELLSQLTDAEDALQKVVPEQEPISQVPLPEEEKFSDTEFEESIPNTRLQENQDQISPSVSLTFEASPTQLQDVISTDSSYYQLQSPDVVQYSQQNTYQQQINTYNTQDDKCTDKSICQLPTETGFCRLGLWRYSYNFNTNQCIGFIYGGCSQNENNFETYDECWQCCAQ
eukprot:TRINITY_DN25480_c0_g2_i1.p1 TRINITY_DN25480_c0_g2~~TRINITY_DN25480_c0_g2_i1.p1  ORF type:complete len:244 (+),score=4.32 TRINITY_DN25480_c0_g2_i1:109-732(+)